MEPTLVTFGIDLIRHYVVRAIDEEALRGSDDTVYIEQLREYCCDVKRSDRFVRFGGIREVHEIYTSVTATEYMRDFIHQGATFTIMSMGEDKWIQMVKQLSKGIIRGYWTSERRSDIAQEIELILTDNPWLVFCVLSRFAWFNEPKKPE